MYNKQRLSNGLRILFAPLKETNAVTVLMMTKVGSRYEAPDINGVSHFLEHMMFKGTDKRPTALDVSKELDGVGADFNAFTGKDYTGYYIKLSREHLTLALDIISDMLLHSKFSETEINKERKVITEEINMYFDNPIMLVDDVFEELMFGKKHPLGQMISGPKSVIAALQRKTIVGYFKRHYFPRNMVLCVSGKFNKAQALSQIQQMFAGVNKRLPTTQFARFQHYQQKPQVRLLNRKTEQVQIALGFPGLPYLHKDLPALGLLTVILGGNMSSRLFTRVREQEGLAYAIHASRSAYQDTGAFVVQAGVDKTRVFPALEHILAELRDVKERGVRDEELAQAKEFLKGKLVLDLEDSEEIANFLTKQELLTGAIETPAQRLRKLEKVRKADIQRVARNIFHHQNLNLALIGPHRETAEFSAFLAKHLV